MKTFYTIMLAGFMLCATPGLRADTCGDIHELSDRWNRLSEYIDKHSDDGKLRKADVGKVIADLKILVPPTQKLGVYLTKEFTGKDQQRLAALGTQMTAALQEFIGLNDKDDDWDDVVDIFSRLVEVIDKVGDQCDK